MHSFKKKFRTLCFIIFFSFGVTFETEIETEGRRILTCHANIVGEMVRQARVLAQATSDLVNAMRSDAEAEIDMDNSKKLLAAAKLLADSTARMVEAAKVHTRKQ